MRTIRTATLADLDIITAVEAECFPPSEAATLEQFSDRLKYYAEHFLLMLEDNKLVAFVDGFVTNERDLTDEMYENAAMHDENGKWQMLFGVNTIPAYRKQGCAGELIRCFIDTAKEQGRMGVVLTCKDRLIHYYEKFGFVNEGLTAKSTHGGVEWYQMRLSFEGKV
ncbi:MAG: GNAT family N-acetyltransferase [Ruminococcus sp.]|nr:GNAT family N-acetyltransferase [Ruminococcus sp.]MBR1753029.1 GNAT family N-acetyltransferase [Ruminococcus sp.]